MTCDTFHMTHNTYNISQFITHDISHDMTFHITFMILLYTLFPEEIFHSNKAHWWSTYGSFICYAQIDDTRVRHYKYPVYGQGTDIYGGFEEIAYPKVSLSWRNMGAFDEGIVALL